MDIFTEKKNIRIEVKKRIAKLSPAQKGLESAMKCAEFIRSDVFLKAKVLFGFMPMKDELDILPILRTALENEKKVLLPKICASSNSSNEMDFYFVESDFYAETEKSAYGMYEPASRDCPARLENIFEDYAGDDIVVFVPGRAFGRDNSRLGRGKGFYDAFLHRLSRFYGDGIGTGAKKRPRYIGVCYGTQIFDSVPHSENDAFVDYVI